MQSPKQVYFSNEDVVFEFQRTDNIVNIHCHANSFKPSKLKLWYSVFNTFLKECEEAGVDVVYTITPNPKFAQLFGGTTGAGLEYEGVKYEVVTWDLRQQPLP